MIILESNGIPTTAMTGMIIHPPHNMEHAIEYGNRLVMLYHGKIVVDVQGEKKKNLTVAELMALFHKNSGQVLNDDALVLG